MNFWDIYNSKSKEGKKELRDSILEKCEIAHPTFYTWKYKKRVPKYEQTIISEILGVEISELFPKP